MDLTAPFKMYQPTNAQRCRSATEKNNILEDLFSSVLSQFKKYHPSGNLEFNYLGIFRSLKLRIFMENILSISLKVNFTPNSLCCYGLSLGSVRSSHLPFECIVLIMCA